MENKRKKIIILSSIAAITLIILMSFSYYLGSQSKNDQLKACHKTMNAVNDLTSGDNNISKSEFTDNLSKCDPTFK
mgnify:CR=1 FL=1